VGQLVVALSLIVLAASACSRPATALHEAADGVRLVRAQVRGIT
jgi:hypothetical protein